MAANVMSPYTVERKRGAAEKAIDQNLPLPVLYSDIDLNLFPHGTIKDRHGRTVPQAHLTGLSLGIYFGNGSDPRCSTFLAHLLQFYRTINESGEHQKLEIIYVSCDPSERIFSAHKSHMPWLHVDYNDPHTEALKEHLRVAPEFEGSYGGQPARSGVPAIVLVGADGAVLDTLHLSCGRCEGERALRRWDHVYLQYQVRRRVGEAAPAQALKTEALK